MFFLNYLDDLSGNTKESNSILLDGIELLFVAHICVT